MSSHGTFDFTTENNPPSSSLSTPRDEDQKNAVKKVQRKKEKKMSSSPPRSTRHKKALSSSFPSDSSDSSDHCFICHSKRSTAANPILCGSFCRCIGQYSAVHQRCIDELVLNHGFFACTICGEPYHIQFPPDMYQFLLLRTWVKWKKIAYATLFSPKGVHPLVIRVTKWLSWVWFSYILVPYAVGAVYYREVLSSMEIRPSFLTLPTTTSLTATHLPTTRAGVPVTVSKMRWTCFFSWVLGSLVGISIRLIWLGWLWWENHVIPRKVKESSFSHTTLKRTKKAKNKKKREKTVEEMASSPSYARHRVADTERERVDSKNTKEGSALQFTEENELDWSNTDFEDEPDGTKGKEESWEDREEEEEEDDDDDNDDGKRQENLDLDVLNKVSTRMVGTAELVRPIQSFLGVLSILEKFTMYADIAYTTMAHLLLGSLFLWLCSSSFFLQCSCWLLFLTGIWWVRTHYVTKNVGDHIFTMKELEILKPHITYREYVVFYILTVFRVIVTFSSFTLSLFCAHIVLSPFLVSSFRGAPTMHLPGTSTEVLLPLSPASTTFVNASSSSSFSTATFAATAAPWETVMMEFNIIRCLLYFFGGFLLMLINHAIDSNVIYYLFTGGVNLFLFHPLNLNENSDPPDEDYLLHLTLNQSLFSVYRVLLLPITLFFSLVLFLLLPLGTCMSIRYMLWGDQLTASWLMSSVDHQRLTTGAKVEKNAAWHFSWTPWGHWGEPIASSPSTLLGEEDTHVWPFSSGFATSRSSFTFYDHAWCPLVSFLMTKFTHTLAHLPLFTSPLPSLDVTAVGSSTGDLPLSPFASSSSIYGREGAKEEKEEVNLQQQKENRNHHVTFKKNRNALILLPLSLVQLDYRNTALPQSEGQVKISPFVREWVYKLFRGPVSTNWGFLAGENAENSNSTRFRDSTVKDVVWKQQEEVRKKVLSILQAKDNIDTMPTARKEERKAYSANFVSRYFQKVVARLAFVRQKTQAGKMCSTLWASVVRDSLSSSEILPISILSLFDVVEGTDKVFSNASSSASYLPVGMGGDENEDHQGGMQMVALTSLGSDTRTCSSTSSQDKNLFFSSISSSPTTSASLSMLVEPQSLGIPCVSVTMAFVSYWTTKLLQQGDAQMNAAFGIVQQRVWHKEGETRKSKRSLRVFVKRVISRLLFLLTFPMRKSWCWMARAWMSYSVMRTVGYQMWVAIGGLTTLRFLCGKTYYVHWMYYLQRVARFWGNVWGLSSYLFMEDTHVLLDLYIILVHEEEKNRSLSDLLDEQIPFDTPPSSFDWKIARRTDLMKKEDIPSYLMLRLYAFYWCFFSSAVLLFWELPIIGSLLGVSWTTELIPLFLLSTWWIAAYIYSLSYFKNFLYSLLAITAILVGLVHLAFQGIFQLAKVVLFGRLADAVYLYAVSEHPHVSTIKKRREASPIRTDST